MIVDIPAELSGNLTALITLGFGIGLAVPQKIEEQQKKLEEKDKKKDLKNLQENNNANA